MRRPADIGLPSRFSEWRRGQSEALETLLYTEDRFNILNLPTGSGKSALYMGYVKLEEEGRACVLTATRALQDQLNTDFAQLGLTDMRGRANYACDIDEDVTAADAVCTAGVYCTLMKHGGCAYYDQRARAAHSNLVVTNYAYWLHDEESQGLGMFRSLILDEAHAAPDQISEYAAVEVTRKDVVDYKLKQPDAMPGHHWALRALDTIERTGKDRKELAYRRRALRLQRAFARLCRLGGEQWIVTKDKEKWRWDLIDPGALSEDLLFRGAHRVILASASVRKKTLKLLGVSASVRVIEQESTFPVQRRPIYYWPVAKLGMSASAADMQAWSGAIDEVVGARADRKGIIHTVSYDRAWEVLKRSQYKRRMLLQKRGDNASEVLARFRRSPPGTVLVSPAVSTGIDFPYSEVEFQVIAKVPFPDTRSPLMRARTERDKTYGLYVAAQTLVQSVGRGMRAADDQCESVIVDGQFGWLYYGYSDFFPRWFRSAVRTVRADAHVPAPPPPL